MADEGYSGVATFLQSGNVIVSTESDRPDEVAGTMERLLSDEFDVNVPCVVRTANQVRGVLERNPLREVVCRGPLVAGFDDLEEEHGAVLVDRHVADLVDHQQSRVRQHAQPPGQVAGGLGLGEGFDQPRERAVVDAPGRGAPAGVAEQPLEQAVGGLGGSRSIHGQAARSPGAGVPSSSEWPSAAAMPGAMSGKRSRGERVAGIGAAVVQVAVAPEEQA